ncbi:MAG: hypothetical protein ABIB79_01655 [archaeon]
MITTIHLLTGAVIGKYIKNIWLIIILALISHYILDFIPHNSPSQVKGYLEGGIKGADTKDLLIKSIDPIIGLILIGYIIYLNKEKAIPLIIGIFFAWFPDLLVYFSWKFDIIWLDRIIPRPGNFFYNKSRSLIVGILTQAIAFISALILLIFPRK